MDKTGLGLKFPTGRHSVIKAPHLCCKWQLTSLIIARTDRFFLPYWLYSGTLAMSAISGFIHRQHDAPHNNGMEGDCNRNGPDGVAILSWTLHIREDNKVSRGNVLEGHGGL